MRTAAIGADGSLPLGDEAQRAGYGPQTLVEIVVLSTGSLLVTPLETTSTVLDLDDILKLPPRARKGLR